ncbi:MAG: class I SAM-dependent methyltransferase [Ignavibacteria bacterium]
MFDNYRKKFISEFKDKVRKTIRENGYTQSYIPYKKFLNEYNITSSKSEYPKCEFGLAVPPKEFRSGYDVDDNKYLEGAQIDVSKMFKIMKEAGFLINDGMKILDFGCSSGRMIRRLKTLADTCEIWGTDVSADFIYWCNQYLNPPFHFATNTFNAHLPFEDKYFNFIYSGSVFTHIDNLIESWFLELRRIMTNDGHLYITVHDNHTVKIFDDKKDIPLASYVNKSSFYKKAIKDFDFFVMNRSRSPLVFFDMQYLEKIFTPMFHIISVTPEAYGYQTGILLKKK